MPAGPALASIWSGNAPPVVMIRGGRRCSAACLITSVICSTAVVTNKASPSDLLIEASWAERSVASGVIVSVTPTFMPLPASALENSAAAPRPKSLLTVRKSAFLIGGLNDPSFSTKATASISEVGLIRNTHGLPATVILPEDDDDFG